LKTNAFSGQACEWAGVRGGGLSVSVRNPREIIRSVVVRTRVFSEWPPNIIDKLIEDADLRRYADGELALHGGEVSKVMAVVHSGTFVCQRLLSSGDAMIFDYLMQGQATSFLAVFDGLPASFDIVARGDSEMVLLQRKSLLDAIALDPGRCWSDVVMMLCRRMRIDYESMFMRATNSLRCQLAKLILYWARGQTKAADGSVRIPVAISQEDIAAMLGKSTVTVSKEINQLIKDGMLARAYKQIQITNRAALEAIVEREDPGNRARSTPFLEQPKSVLSAAD
jgi:CRP/FNR family cyclic AMP-dependent transcriptional regulator